ncbi:MAG TPA: cation diffusion facilitator family transporter [Conexivisphaerales archaeon]|nr:cation diffusion facilitator family transporter [Conexivisphaerales archaeon]
MRSGDGRIRVATVSLLASVLLVVIKLGAYLTTGSLSVLAEVLHSTLDFFATLVTLSAVTYAAKPPDVAHLYGHGKAENLGGLTGAILIMATSLWVLYEGVDRLIHSVSFTPSLAAVFVMAISMVVDYERSKALLKAAKKYHSQALEADALHFSSDLISAAAVLGVVCVGVLAPMIAPLPHFVLVWLDVGVAVFVAAWFAWQGYHLSVRAISELLDKAPAEIVAEAESIAKHTDGVISVRNVRSRRSGPRIFMDMAITVAEGTPISKAHEIASNVEKGIKEGLGDVDLVIHVEPESHEGLRKKVISAASAVQGVKGVHSVLVTESHGELNIRLHVGVDPGLTVAEAHKVADGAEKAVKLIDPAVSNVIVHAEPFSQGSNQEVVGMVNSLMAESPLLRGGSVAVETIGEVTYVDISCVARGSAQLVDTHDLVTLLEDRVREHLGGDVYVTIHVEPLGNATSA